MDKMDLKNQYQNTFELSSDGKSAQPQILIGLVVNSEGFPVAYEVFEGNTFEGKTIIPVIKGFQSRHRVKELTVVADAGMISLDNIAKLKEAGLTYIVGAQMASLSQALAGQVSKQLGQRDGAAVRVTTPAGTLVCDFSMTRYRKDRREMEKQVERAKKLVSQPGSMKRVKFVALPKGALAPTLNEDLLRRTEGLLGIKGYYTNLDSLDDQAIIAQYHSLWQVEHSFRIAKGDLQTRPVYHFKRETVEAHVLICFMALAVAKYAELKGKKSIKRIIRSLKQVSDARIASTVSGDVTTLRTAISEEVREIADNLGLKI